MKAQPQLTLDCLKKAPHILGFIFICGASLSPSNAAIPGTLHMPCSLPLTQHEDCTYFRAYNPRFAYKLSWNNKSLNKIAIRKNIKFIVRKVTYYEIPERLNVLFSRFPAILHIKKLSVPPDCMESFSYFKGLENLEMIRSTLSNVTNNPCFPSLRKLLRLTSLTTFALKDLTDLTNFSSFFHLRQPLAPLQEICSYLSRSSLKNFSFFLGQQNDSVLIQSLEPLLKLKKLEKLKIALRDVHQRSPQDTGPSFQELTSQPEFKNKFQVLAQRLKSFVLNTGMDYTPQDRFRISSIYSDVATFLLNLFQQKGKVAALELSLDSLVENEKNLQELPGLAPRTSRLFIKTELGYPYDIEPLPTILAPFLEPFSTLQEFAFEFHFSPNRTDVMKFLETTLTQANFERLSRTHFRTEPSVVEIFFRNSSLKNLRYVHVTLREDHYPPLQEEGLKPSKTFLGNTGLFQLKEVFWSGGFDLQMLSESISKKWGKEIEYFNLCCSKKSPFASMIKGLNEITQLPKLKIVSLELDSSTYPLDVFRALKNASCKDTLESVYLSLPDDAERFVNADPLLFKQFRYFFPRLRYVQVEQYFEERTHRWGFPLRPCWD